MHKGLNSRFVVLNLLVLFCCAVFAPRVNAQSTIKHFIYIQSDKNQPFYAILDHKVYESSSIGYLIISKLSNGKYNLKIGFPKEKYPAQTFVCKVNNTDAGYGLKSIGDDWKLINLQTREELAIADGDNSSESATQAEIAQTAANKSNSFSDMLSQASGNKPVVKAVVPAVVDKVVEKEIPTVAVSPTNVAPAASVVKLKEESSRLGTRAAYVDATNGANDTVDIYIPNTVEAKPSAIEQEATKSIGDADTNNTSNTNPFYTGNVTAEKVKTVADEPTTMPVKAVTETKKVSEAIVAEKSTVTGLVNSNCTDLLSDKDLTKVKGKMIDKNSASEKMIAAAQKYIGTKCVSTEQVKALGNLLLSDEARLSLYRVLYNNVYDMGQYGVLESQLLAPEYKSQFRSLIGH